MTENMQKLLILLGGIAVVLILVILLFTKNSPFMRFMRRFLADDEEVEQKSAPRKKSGNNRSNSGKPRLSSDYLMDIAMLVRKCDDRLRIIESNGQVRYLDETFQLIFVTKNGSKVQLDCSRDAYERVPFNQEGSLAYKNNQFIRFKMYDGVVNN